MFKVNLSEVSLVSLLTASIVYQSWPLGWCAVAVLGFTMAQKAYADFLASKTVVEKNTLSVVTLSQQVEMLSGIVGKLQARLNHIGQYVGEANGQ